MNGTVVRRSPVLVPALAAAALALGALAIAANAGVKSAGIVPDAARVALALVALVCAAGYAPARLLVPRGMEPHFPLLVGLVGCATAGLALTGLGFLRVPWDVSLPLVLATGGVAAIVVRARLGPARPTPEDLAAAGGRLYALALPLYLAVLLTALLLVPAFRDELLTVYGTNPDGHLSVGAAEFLQNARPETVDESLPVDRMPLVWRSKYPIYYVFAGASSLSGLAPIESFATVAAVLAALTALAFALLARYALRASPVGALLAMGLVGLDRLLALLALHPYHNQLWGTLALPLMLLFGWRFLAAPDVRVGILFALFLVLGVLAYPLMAVFPALALLAAAVVQYRRGEAEWIRALRLPRGRSGRLLAAALVIVCVPAAIVLLKGVFEKSGGAADVILPGRDLSAWRGDLKAFPPLGVFFGAPGGEVGPNGVGGLSSWIGGIVGAGVIGAALLGLRRLPREVAAGLGAMAAGGLAAALYFRLRDSGEYFYFKLLAFLAPALIAVAAVWLAEQARSARRVAAAAASLAVILLAAVSLAGLRQEVRNTGAQLNPKLLELREVARLLPPGSSIRLDLPDDGSQLWAGHMLASHPLSATRPLVGTTYPHVPKGRKADYILAHGRYEFDPWPDSKGKPLFDNGDFRVYRMDPEVPGPDFSSKRMKEGLGAELE